PGYHRDRPSFPTRRSSDLSSVQAVISGEMRVEDVPLAPWVDLQALKAGDPEPMEIVVEIPAGKSKRGWNYRPEALQKIVGEVMRSEEHTSELQSRENLVCR